MCDRRWPLSSFSLFQFAACISWSTVAYATTPRFEISEAGLRRLVAEYAALAPTHLTSTSSDSATSDWISAELGQSDLEVEFQSYQMPGGPLWIPSEIGTPSSGYGCRLMVDNIDVPCYVVQRPPLEGASLEFVPMQRVLVVSMSGAYISSPEDVYREHLLPDGTLPFDIGIVISDGLSGDAVNITQPSPFDWYQVTSPESKIPLVTVGSAFYETLANATLVTSLSIHGNWSIGASSRNVLARPKHRIPAGCDASVPALPLYIGTPINGFFRAAGERGGGIALLLALAQSTAAAPIHCPSLSQPRCRLPIFGFTSGHEAGDPGIFLGAIPYMQALGASLNVSLSEIPFISVGADLGVFANFDEGVGQGISPVTAATSSPTSDSMVGDYFLDVLLSQLANATSFVVSHPREMNLSNAHGAIVQAMKAGMPAMNMASHVFQRFHLPSDAGADSVNFTALHVMAKATSAALGAAFCSEPSSDRLSDPPAFFA